MISDVLADAVPELDAYLDDAYPGSHPEGELLERILDLRARMIGLRYELGTLADESPRYAVLRADSVIGRNLSAFGARNLADEVGGEAYAQLGGAWTGRLGPRLEAGS